MKPYQRIIFPVDVSDIRKATALVNKLLPYVGIFKFGFESIYSTMADLLLSSKQEAMECLTQVRLLAAAVGHQAFLDVKLDDIPNTVGQASLAIARMNPKMLNVHASAGQEAIKRAAANKGAAKLLGVTVLTSIDDKECVSIFGDKPDIKVLQFSKMLLDAGADGVICAPKEGQLIRTRPEFSHLLVVCPNIRPPWTYSKDDQNKERQMTPFDAIASGIDMLVIGRPISNPPVDVGGPVEAARRIAQEISSALDCGNGNSPH